MNPERQFDLSALNRLFSVDKILLDMSGQLYSALRIGEYFKKNCLNPIPLTDRLSPSNRFPSRGKCQSVLQQISLSQLFYTGFNREFERGIQFAR